MSLNLNLVSVDDHQSPNFSNSELKVDLDIISKKVVVLGEERAGRIELLNSLARFYFQQSSENSPVKRIKIRNFKHKNKTHNFTVLETTGYEENSSKLELNDLSSKYSWVDVFY